MKNKFLALVSLVFLLSTFGGKAQQNISLSFSSTSNLDSVRIDNLNNTSYKVLKGSYNFVLQLEAPNLIESIDMFSEPLVYPNPFTQQVNFEFLSAYQNKVNLAVYDLSGKVVAQLNQNINLGSHRFSFKPSKPGVYLMKVSDKSKIYNAKIICTEGNSNHSIIEYAGLVGTQTTKPIKVISKMTNSLTDLTVKSGDMLRFTGYSSSKINSIYDLVYSTKNYTFSFADRYFKFKNYNIQASKPSFVDIMFSVTDINNKGVDYLSNSDFSVLEDNVTTSPTETFRFVRKMQQIPSKIKTVLLLDNSTSVSSDIETIKNAAIKFIQSIRNEQEIAIYAFSDTPVLLQNFTTNKILLQNAIKSINSGFPSTNLYGSTITTLSQWTDSYTLYGIVQGSLIVFTDGSDTQGSSTLNAVITSRGDKKIYVIGLGSEINPTALNQIANPGPYYPIQKTSELDAVFTSIQSDIVQFSNSFYWLNYLSPKRTGTHTLKVSAINNINTTATSYLTGSFSAVGFQPVKSGVYVNIDDVNLYGIDIIRCYYSTASGFRFTFDNGINEFRLDSLVLKPVTYWAIKTPVFSWLNNKSNVCDLKVSTYSVATIFPKITTTNIAIDTAIITLKDDANSYRKNILLIKYAYAPIITTSIVNNTSKTSATCGGNITSDEGSPIISSGVCWSTSPNPTINNSKTTDGKGTGLFTSTLSGLIADCTYYVRAYAINGIGISYGNEVRFKTYRGEIVDIDGNVYNTVTIGNQIWMAENLKTTKYNDGTSIPLVTDAYLWSNLTTPGYCWYNNAIANKNIYGALYNWYAVNTAKLAPKGWHIPSDTEWTTLSTYLDGSIAGGKLKDASTTYWTAPNTGATNETSFSALPGGIRGGNAGSFGDLTMNGYWWSSYTQNSISNAWFLSLLYNENFVYPGSFYKDNGISVRCVKDEIPILTTTSISAITSSSATSGGSIAVDGVTSIIVRGVCWSTSQSPTILNYKTIDSNGTGSFLSNITGLLPNTTYYVRAYATSIEGTMYGNEISFSTNLPTVTTSSISPVMATTATTGGNVTLIGGAEVISRGVCWSTSSNPTVTLSTKTNDGNGSGAFTSNISGLSPNVKYYMRAYATNSIGTSYGSEISFTTKSGIISLTTTSVSDIMAYSATSGSSISNNAGSEIIARGVCWSTTSNPTIDISTKTSDGNGNGTIVSNINGLTLATTYYIRAYTTNSAGITYYGNEISFKTQNGVPLLTTTSVSYTGDLPFSGGNITSDGGLPITARGICWSTTSNPTVELTTKTNDGAGTGTYVSSFTGLTTGNKYYLKSYATNSLGTTYGAEISFSAGIGIGVNYAGGIIFYIDNTGQHGIVCASIDQNSGVQWYNGSNVTVNASGTAIGTGNSNTNQIVAWQKSGTYAAKICYDLVLNTYSDWYLPSKDELLLMFNNLAKNNIGNLSGSYWSSSEYSSDMAWYIYPFSSGQSMKRSSLNKVRAARSF
ncbi:MAG: FISUMP domain-containing protein [Paludibacter sp.]